MDLMISPFGIWMGSGWIAFRLFLHGELRVGLCPVFPVSTTAISSTDSTSLGLD